MTQGKHSLPELDLECWEGLANRWDVVSEKMQQLIDDRIRRLATKDTTPDLTQVRVYQAEIKLLGMLQALPEIEIERLGKQSGS